MFRKDQTALGLVLAIVGCTGSVGAPPQAADPGSPVAGQSGGTGNSGGRVGAGGTGSVGAAGASGGSGSSAGIAGSGGPGGSAGGTPNQPPPLVLDPGRTVIRRLNRTEYNLTVRDLLGTASSPANSFPADELAEGFDTVGEHLAFSLLHAEQMEASATALVDELFALAPGDARRAKVLVCALQVGAEATCARQILTTFARRAYRRPATAQEVTALMALVDKVRVGGTYTDGLKAALTAVLLSPHFLFKEETSVGFASTSAKALNAFEIATRLSYFLWSTMPDDALAASANGGALATNASELAAQIDRMMKDPKASALTKNFAWRWLTLYRLDTVAPDSKVYGSYDDSLRASAQQETSLFFEALVRDNLPLTTLITADFTYANARLGRHYGVSVTGDSLTRVNLGATSRMGLLTQTSFLMSNAHPDRTAPVFRGDWILDRILCAATPPPPNNIDIPPLDTPPAGSSGRQVLEAHRKQPLCAACHNSIDPLGLGLENFDGIGSYRTMDNGVLVDASGTLPGGATFRGATELAALIAQDPRFTTCVAKQLLTYGVGRAFSNGPGMEYASALSKHAIAAGQGSWRSWIAMVASSEAFRTNRGDPP